MLHLQILVKTRTTFRLRNQNILQASLCCSSRTRSQARYYIKTLQFFSNDESNSCQQKRHEKILNQSQPRNRTRLFIHLLLARATMTQQALLCTLSWKRSTRRSKLIRKKILPTLKRKCNVLYRIHAPHPRLSR